MAEQMAQPTAQVLILVLVDVGLGHTLMHVYNVTNEGLNPCFSGCWSRTEIVDSLNEKLKES